MEQKRSLSHMLAASGDADSKRRRDGSADAAGGGGEGGDNVARCCVADGDHFFIVVLRSERLLRALSEASQSAPTGFQSALGGFVSVGYHYLLLTAVPS